MINNFELQIKQIECLVKDYPQGEIVTNPSHIFKIAQNLIGNKTQEHFIVIVFNTRNQVLGYYTAAIGGIDYCSVDLRSVFRIAIVAGGSALCFLHNHPSGYLDPSSEDINLTKQIKEASKLLGLNFS